jgi:uncharacterized protein
MEVRLGYRLAVRTRRIPMAMSAGAAMPLPPASGSRSFALLDQVERARLAPLLRPLPWLDGFLTAIIISPAEPSDWPNHVYAESAPEQLELSQEDEIASVIDDHFMHVVDALYDDPDAYRPYLNGAGDPMEAAAQWAAGFRFGIRLQPEPWRPIVANGDARSLLTAIFSLERDEHIAEEERTESPFRDMPADRREHMRHSTLEVLPSLVIALHAFSLELDGGEDTEEVQVPYERSTPKVGRNDPCPCGSGKKHKTCCLGEAEA